MKNKFFAKFDYFLILVVLSLVTLGILFIYSSSVNSEGISVTNEHIKQIIWPLFFRYFDQITFAIFHG